MFTAGPTLGIDGKNRVSIPAPYRVDLAAGMPEQYFADHPRDEAGRPVGQSWIKVVLLPGVSEAGCLEGMPVARHEQICTEIFALEDQPLEEPDPEIDALYESLIATAHTINLDDTGRIVLPQPLRDYAGLEKQAAFRGRGRTFQIWNPNRMPKLRDPAGAMTLLRRKAAQAAKLDGTAQAAKLSGAAP